MSKPKDFRARIRVPIYPSVLILSHSSDIMAAIAKEKLFIGVEEDAADCAGGVSIDDHHGHFGIFLLRGSATHGVIGHETFHVTHRILQWHGIVFTTDNHEPFTYLTEYLTAWIYQQLKRARIKVS
jgi:hypothetical protein